MGILDAMRSWFSRGNEEEEEAGAPPVFVVSSPDLVEITMVPKDKVPYIWSLMEKDSALTFLEDKEIEWIQWKIAELAELASFVELEVPHPKIRRIVYHSIRQWIDRENIELLGYFRLKRNWRGMERRLTTITAPATAMRGY